MSHNKPHYNTPNYSFVNVSTFCFLTNIYFYTRNTGDSVVFRFFFFDFSRTYVCISIYTYVYIYVFIYIRCVRVSPTADSNAWENNEHLQTRENRTVTAGRSRDQLHPLWRDFCYRRYTWKIVFLYSLFLFPPSQRHEINGYVDPCYNHGLGRSSKTVVITIK